VKTLHTHTEGISVGLTYFKERGVREDIIKKFQLGYSLEERNAFTVEAQKAGYKIDYLIKTGLSLGGEHNKPFVDRFRGRVLFPVHSISGKVVAFGGRILKKVENVGKYLNSPESDIYSKSKELYGIYFAKNAIVKKDKCFLVEGYTDVISMHQAGIENVVASSGTALTHGQIRMIHRFTENITVLYDGDRAGINAALRGIDLLLEDGMNVKVVLLPDGEDPDSFARKQNSESFHRFIFENETDFIRFKTNLLIDEVGDDPIKRSGMISNIVKSIAIIPNAITRSVYIQECALSLKIAENVLISEINKIRLKEWDAKKQKNDREEIRLSFSSSVSTDVNGVAKTESNTKIRDIAPFDKFERQIIRYIVRYGNSPIYQKFETRKRKEGKNVIEEQVLTEEGPGVTEFVQFDLERDDLTFSNDLYRLIFDKAVEKIGDKDFNSGQYFLNYPNSKVSELASDMLSDRYQLSTIHSKILGEEVGDKSSRLLEQNHLINLVPRATTELKNAYVMQKIKEVKEELKNCINDNYTELITQLKQLQEIKKVLAKELGERIVLKY
jgi:DNA primase